MVRGIRILLFAVFILAAGGFFGYTGWLVYKSYQPGELVVCGFQPGQRVMAISPGNTGSYSREVISEADAQGKAAFSQLGQGRWYILDQQKEGGWYSSKYLKHRPFYVAGLERRSYNCSPNSPKWSD